MDALTQSEQEIFTRMLTSHAYRERLAAERFADAKEIAPSPDARSYVEHVSEEEEEHYRGCLDVAAEFGIPIEHMVARRMEQSPPGIPQFNCWLDVLLAHAFNDQAGYFVLAGVMGCKIPSYARLAKDIVAEEAAHGAHGAELLIDYYPQADTGGADKRDLLLTHLDAAVRCLGRPNSPGDKEAIDAGLKSIPATDTIKQFCSYADDILMRLGCQDLTPLASRYLHLQ